MKKYLHSRQRPCLTGASRDVKKEKECLKRTMLCMICFPMRRGLSCNDNAMAFGGLLRIVCSNVHLVVSFDVFMWRQ